MNPDVIIDVRFFLPEEGGRETAVREIYYACSLFIEEEGFDCRLILNEKWIYLGLNYEIPVKFLLWENALKKIKIGSNFYLREGRSIAKGRVVEIINY